MYVIINKKRCMLMCIPVLAAGLIIGSLLSIIPGEKTFGYGSGKILKVVIDAGHGGPDGGAVGINDTVEAEINLEIAKKLETVLNGKGIDTVMTRTDNEGLRAQNSDGWRKTEDMRMRLQMIKKSDADFFISIHMNHFRQSSVHGLRLFYASNHEEIKPLAENMQKKMSEITGAKVSTVSAADKRLFLMKSPPMPAILAECGFLSNAAEEKNLADEEYQAKLAWAIAEAVEAHFMGDEQPSSES